ncbi:YIP1 family protein [Paenirhodobacter sp.]|uniref:YIP1 family protein n=1 Tax=Paenirhodobacter sp. TaxID=1965326 RepID=UPI003B3EE7E7
MAAVDDILRSYRAPRAVVRGLLARPRSEPWGLTLLLVALTVIFIGQWPRLAAIETPEMPLTGLLLGTALALGATVPLFYGLAALGHLVARLLGGRGDWYGARIALFWALLAVAPLMLFQGLVAGFIGMGQQLALVSALVFLAFVLIWGAGLRVAEFEDR